MALTEAGVAAMAHGRPDLPARRATAGRGARSGHRPGPAPARSASPMACPSWWCATCCSPRWTTARRAAAVPRGRVRPPAGGPGAAPAGRRAVGPRRRRPIPTCACTATSWAKRRCPGSRRRAMAKQCKQPFPACLAEMPVLLPTGHAAVRPRHGPVVRARRACARASRASSRTARCWRPSAAAAWAPSRPRAGRARNCWRTSGLRAAGRQRRNWWSTST